MALDVYNTKRALQIARESVDGGADWVEAGTPLIKSEGLEIVRELKRQFKGCKVVADLKTMDVGGLEAELAARAGADVVVVMAVADDGCISEAVRVARKYGIKVMVDMMSVTDMAERAGRLEGLGVDLLCIHTGIDEQMIGGDPLDRVRSLAKATSLPIAAAGGLNSETVSGVLEAGASIAIVGGAITKAKDVTAATRSIRQAMDSKKVVKSELFKKYGPDKLLEAFSKVSTPNIADAQHKKGAMKNIRPVYSGIKMAGPALTVRTADGDWAKTVEAIDVAEPGDVLVIDAGRGHTAVWGELASNSCMMKKLAGVVIDGATRDADDIERLQFPVFSRNIVPNAGEPKGFGEIGTEVMVGEQPVSPGDWIVGDDSGVVVVKKERVMEVANRALDVLERENRIREEIRRGSTLSLVLELGKWEKVD